VLEKINTDWLAPPDITETYPARSATPRDLDGEVNFGYVWGLRCGQTSIRPHTLGLRCMHIEQKLVWIILENKICGQRD